MVRSIYDTFLQVVFPLCELLLNERRRGKPPCHPPIRTRNECRIALLSLASSTFRFRFSTCRFPPIVASAHRCRPGDPAPRQSSANRECTESRSSSSPPVP